VNGHFYKAFLVEGMIKEKEGGTAVGEGERGMGDGGKKKVCSLAGTQIKKKRSTYNQHTIITM